MVEEPRYTPGMLGAITAPTLVLAGDRDLIRPAHTALIAASLPHAKLVTIPRSDHWIFDRQPVPGQPGNSGLPRIKKRPGKARGAFACPRGLFFLADYFSTGKQISVTQFSGLGSMAGLTW